MHVQQLAVVRLMLPDVDAAIIAAADHDASDCRAASNPWRQLSSSDVVLFLAACRPDEEGITTRSGIYLLVLAG